ncbi:MAG: hypothetical protein EOM20_20265, partial [Spartobacteria bacterium]|nr:hypothetical protein [Spartobacteria bacterium]
MSVRWFVYVCAGLMAALAWAPAGYARSPEREVVAFSTTWDVGYGTNVCVVGNHADLGLWSPTSSVKLQWTSGNVWTGQIAIQKGTDFEYKYIARNGATNIYCDPDNVIWEPGDDRTLSTGEAPEAPYDGKTVFYYSSWTSATLLIIGTNISSADMRQVGPGRSGGEFLYRVDGVGEAGEGMEFVPNGWLNGTNYWDNPVYGDWNNNYYTTLDTFLLQDGDIYNYQPASYVSPPRIISNYVNSTVPVITGRLIRIYLPRGYDEHTWKRYPVLYMHDGTNVFDPGGTFGSWSADATATKEISQGRMRECIIVAIDNAANRRAEYEPPGDTYTGEPPGHADQYLLFVMNNVRPTLDYNYHTLTDRRNTLVGGSSMGGLVSIYCGYATNVFGGVMAMSPSITRAPNYTAALRGKTKQPMRMYVDTGADEGNVGIGTGNYWEKPWEAYDIFLAQGYAVNENLIMRVGCGHYHNEAAWRNRLHLAFRFLLPVRDDPNMLAQATWPPVFSGGAPGPEITFHTQQHFSYALETRETGSLMTGGWSNLSPAVTEENPWNVITLTNTA